MITAKEIESYKKYGKAVCLTNGVIEAYVTVDVGPRIIRFGFAGQQNIMNSNREEFAIMTDKNYEDFWGNGKHWENFGGHRVWVTPEVFPQTYSPDDAPVKYELTESGAVFTAAAEPTGIRKQIEIKLDPDDANMQVINRVKNVSNEDKEFSVWSISVADKGGTLIIPMNTNDTAPLSNRIISVWPYTDLGDRRIKFGDKYAILHHNSVSPRPIKLGFDLNCGNIYYCLNGDIFCKSFETKHPESCYPDGGCSFETYINEYFTELESLSPVIQLAAGETAEHTEHWSLIKMPCEVDFESEESIDNLLSRV